MRDKTDALFSHPPKGTPQDFLSLKRKIYRSTRQASKYANEIAGMVYKQEALLMHMVYEIEMVDTGKGMETYNTRREI